MRRKMECGSACNGKVAEGCRHCIEGSKMVLFVTGRCGWNCYYCPVSLEKKNKDVIYANEGRVETDEEIVAEAEAMAATGTGITGGDPLLDMDRTIHMIRLLKQRFGREHHIHLYTATIDPEKAKALENAELDEIRFHPPEDMWTRMSETKLKDVCDALSIPVGIEVPAIPNRVPEMNALVEYAKSCGVSFVNLNELEFSESNWDMMEAYGYQVRDDLSSAVEGSREAAMAVIKANRKMPVHFCSSTFKDGVQLRRRLIRRAEHTAKAYQQVTEDGTIMRGLLYASDVDAAAAELRSRGVPEDLFEVQDGRIEVAPWILEKIAQDLEYKCYLSEQYPTADGLEVERTPL